MSESGVFPGLHKPDFILEKLRNRRYNDSLAFPSRPPPLRSVTRGNLFKSMVIPRSHSSLGRHCLSPPACRWTALLFLETTG